MRSVVAVELEGDEQRVGGILFIFSRALQQLCAREDIAIVLFDVVYR